MCLFTRMPLTSVALPRCFVRFLSFEVRMWRKKALLRFTFPVPVFLKRLAAPLCVFSFGISISSLAFSTQQSAFSHESALPLRGC